MTPIASQMHDALVGAERVLTEVDALLRRRHPTLPMLPELMEVRLVLARFVGDDEV